MNEAKKMNIRPITKRAITFIGECVLSGGAVNKWVRITTRRNEIITREVFAKERNFLFFVNKERGSDFLDIDQIYDIEVLDASILEEFALKLVDVNRFGKKESQFLENILGVKNVN